MLQLTGLTLSAGGRELMVGIDWHLRPGERVGLVGRNGVGKTTLLRTIAGEHEADSGDIRRGGRIGYLPQHGVSTSDDTLWNEARSGMTQLLELEARLNRAIEALDGSEASIARHEKAEAAFRMAGGYAAEERIGEVLFGLGFRKDDWTRSCTQFSGGWQMRIALARLLLAQPEVLLLDEPTNHLDLHARAWLARHLAQHKGALVLVSHDRFVLDRCVSGIVELQHGGIDHYPGTFGRYLVEREERKALLRATREKQGAEAAKLQRFVERFGAKATKAKQAQSRAKRLEKLEAQMVDVREDQAAPRMRFVAPPARGADVLTLRKASAGWDAALFEGLDLHLHRGEAWALLGANGTGKTTLLRALAGEHPLMSGTRALGKGVRVGVFSQDQTRALDAEATGVDVVLEGSPFCTETRARSLLGSLGLQGEKALQPIKTLSGGEKARVALARLAARELDVLLLDEPTNHLDVVSVGVLAQALKAFEGLVVFVSHDRWLISTLATHVLRFDEHGLDLHEGVRPEDLEPPALRVETPTEQGSDNTDWKARQKAKREAERNRKKLAATEERIAVLEERLSEVDEALGTQADDPDAVTELLSERQRVSDELDEAMELWEKLAE